MSVLEARDARQRRSRGGRRPWAWWRERSLVLALLLLGAALRLPGIGDVPPGLYHDEAQHGLDALRVLGGEFPLYFEANNGREPAFIYLVTGAVALLGRSPLAIRLPSFFIGILTLAATYDLARALFAASGQATARRMGRLALATLAVTFWHVHLSRVGFRAVLLPLFTALYLAQGVRAVRVGRAVHWIAAGALYGASWYTYMAARATPVAIAAVAVHGLYLDWQRRRHGLAGVRWRGLARGAMLSAAAALAVLLPLGLYTLAHPDVVLARTGQVSILSASIHHGRFWATLAQHTLRTLGMFAVQGDRIWRHNLAWRPVWDPALGLAFTLGLGVCLAGALLPRRPVSTEGEPVPQLEFALILLWTGVMALPTLLAEDAPHFLRAVGVLPTAALIPAVGMAWLSASLRRVARLPLLAALLPWSLLGFGLASTTHDYFVRYPAATLAYMWFESGAVDLAEQLNALRGSGWDGAQVRRPAPDEVAPALYIDKQLWDEWSSLPFLIDVNVAFLPQQDDDEKGAGAVYAVWPYRDWEPDVLPRLPHPAYLQIHEGPEAQGDQDPAPFTTAFIIAATARPPVPEPVARFEGGVYLRAALVGIEADGGAELRLWWETTAPIADDYTVFAHYVRDGERIAQHDGQPGLGHLRTSFWQPGDLVLDLRPLGDIVPQPGRDTLRLGLYHASTGQNLALVDAAGQSLGETAFDLPVIVVEE